VRKQRAQGRPAREREGAHNDRAPRHRTADEIAAIATTTNVILAPPPTETAFT
jgi:hypothetical protein